MQDFTGGAGVVDLAAMAAMRGPAQVATARNQPLSPVDLVIDHLGDMVDHFADGQRLHDNVAIEMPAQWAEAVTSSALWAQKAFHKFPCGALERASAPGNSSICRKVKSGRGEDGTSHWGLPRTLVALIRTHPDGPNGLRCVGLGCGRQSRLGRYGLANLYAMLIPEGWWVSS